MGRNGRILGRKARRNPDRRPPTRRARRAGTDPGDFRRALEYLGYPAGQPMMEARRIVYASDGLPIRYFILRYHPDLPILGRHAADHGHGDLQARQD